MFFARRMNIAGRLLFLVVLVFAGFSALIVFAVSAFQRTQINGPVYARIVQGKDIVADVLPPPRYIIESYLVALRMLHETDSQRIEGFVQQLDRLKGEFDSRGTFWESTLDPAHPSWKSLIQDSRDPALRFYQILFERYIPAIREGRLDDALAMAYGGDLSKEYEAHRLAVDEVVLTSSNENLRLEAEARDSINKVLLAVCLVTGLIALLVLAVAVLIARSIRQPLAALNHQVAEMAQGHGDLTARLPENHDETGALAHGFNEFIQAFHSGLLRLSGVSGAISGQARNMEDRLSLQVHPALQASASSVEAIGSSTSQAQANLSVLNRGMDELEKGLAQVLQGMENQHQIIENACLITSRLDLGAREAAGFAQGFRSAAQTLLSASESSSQASSDIKDRIMQIQELSEAIHQVLEVVDQIRDRTSILSMNASIEAAHAGEYGRGFSVVAEEIRKLAEHTGENLEAIQANLGSIRGVIKSAVDLSGQVAVQTAASAEQAAGVRAQAEGLAELMARQHRETDGMNHIMGTLKTEADRMAQTGRTQTLLMEHSREALGMLTLSMRDNTQRVDEHQHSMTGLMGELSVMSNDFDRIRLSVGDLEAQLRDFGLNHSKN